MLIIIICYYSPPPPFFFFLFKLACGRVFIKMHSIKSRFCRFVFGKFPFFFFLKIIILACGRVFIKMHSIKSRFCRFVFGKFRLESSLDVCVCALFSLGQWWGWWILVIMITDDGVEDGYSDVVGLVVCLQCNSTGNWALTDVSIIFLRPFRLCIQTCTLFNQIPQTMTGLFQTFTWCTFCTVVTIFLVFYTKTKSVHTKGSKERHLLGQNTTCKLSG